MAGSLNYVFLFVLIACVSSEVVKFSPCPGVDQNKCSVSEVRITPCKQAPRACRLRKGFNTSIAFDYTPNFESTKLETAVHWVNGGTEPKFPGLESDGCKFTKCPVSAGKSEQFNFELSLGKKLPKGAYPIKWKLWDTSDESKACCFITDIVLV